MSIHLHIAYCWFFKIIPVTTKITKRILCCENCGHTTQDFTVDRCRFCSKKNLIYKTETVYRIITKFNEMLEDIPELEKYQDYAYNSETMDGIYKIDPYKHKTIIKNNYDEYSFCIDSNTFKNPPELHDGVMEKLNFIMEKFREYHGADSIFLDYGVIGSLG